MNHSIEEEFQVSRNDSFRINEFIFDAPIHGKNEGVIRTLHLKSCKEKTQFEELIPVWDLLWNIN